METDPLRTALHDATVAVLLGSTTVPVQQVDANGVTYNGTVTIASAFGERIRSEAFRGKFDELIQSALDKIDPAEMAKHIEHILAKEVILGLEKRDQWSSSPNWLQGKVKDIAVEACTVAIRGDNELIDILRTKVSSEVDRNRVGITVNLTNPEA